MIERKILKEALFLEKERAQVMLNSIGDAVLSTDVSGNVTYLNLVAESMTGWPWKEASGRPLAEIFKIIDGYTREPARSPRGARHPGKQDCRVWQRTVFLSGVTAMNLASKIPPHPSTIGRATLPAP